MIARRHDGGDELRQRGTRGGQPAHYRVLTHKNAAPRICRHAAAMYAYASETRHAYQQRKPATEAGRFRYDHWITALGNGRQPHYLASRNPPNQFRVIR